MGRSLHFRDDADGGDHARGLGFGEFVVGAQGTGEGFTNVRGTERRWKSELCCISLGPDTLEVKSWYAIH